MWPLVVMRKFPCHNEHWLALRTTNLANVAKDWLATSGHISTNFTAELGCGWFLRQRINWVGPEKLHKPLFLHHERLGRFFLILRECKGKWEVDTLENINSWKTFVTGIKNTVLRSNLYHCYTERMFSFHKIDMSGNQNEAYAQKIKWGII